MSTVLNFCRNLFQFSRCQRRKVSGHQLPAQRQARGDQDPWQPEAVLHPGELRSCAPAEPFRQTKRKMPLMKVETMKSDVLNGIKTNANKFKLFHWQLNHSTKCFPKCSAVINNLLTFHGTNNASFFKDGPTPASFSFIFVVESRIWTRIVGVEGNNAQFFNQSQNCPSVQTKSQSI